MSYVMKINNQITREKQFIVRCENSLALEKLKKRKADTRRKIELGGLIIKVGLNAFDKSTLLGGLDYIIQLIQLHPHYLAEFKLRGDILFTQKNSPP